MNDEYQNDFTGEYENEPVGEESRNEPTGGEYSIRFSSSMPELPPEHHAHSHSKKKKQTRRIIAVAVICSLLGGLVGAGGALLGSHLLNKQEEPGTADTQTSVMIQGLRESSVIQTVTMDTGEELTPAEVYAANVNSTVGITTSITTNYWGYQTTSAASGSGFIITDDGYILTNYHVVEDSNSISVSLYDGSVYEATLIGYDESNDIAVLKVEAEGLVPVVLGDSDNLNVGDSVVAIGNPLGELTFSLTCGAVSAKDREVTLSSSVTMDLIQTDCAINSGNSGGALFNLYGEVIGITNAKYSSSGSEASIDNIGFAIPINTVLPIVESIIEKGYISKPYIGVTVANVSTESKMYGLPSGAAVYAVTEGGPAEEAGLQYGDIITHVDGVEISSSDDLKDHINDCAAGDKLVLTVYRQGQTLELTVTVAEQIQSALPEQTSQQSQQQNTMPGWGFPGRG